MILYDQNYNFIGVSNETVSFLGYESIQDFMAQHNDFSELLVQKEGYIYNFQNFSWLDYILYSGAPNKEAIVKLKSGEEVEIKITVKEVFLTRELEGVTKFYGVRLITDQFIKIASKVNPNIKREQPKSNFSLNSIIDPSVAPQEEDEEKRETTPDLSINLIKSEDEPKATQEPSDELEIDIPDSLNSQNLSTDDLEIKPPLFGNSIENETQEERLRTESVGDFSIKLEIDKSSKAQHNDTTQNLNIKLDEDHSGDLQADDFGIKAEEQPSTPTNSNGIDLSFLKINLNDEEESKSEAIDEEPQAVLKKKVEPQISIKEKSEEESEWSLKKGNMAEGRVEEEKRDFSLNSDFIKSDGDKESPESGSGNINIFSTIEQESVAKKEELKQKSKADIINQIKIDLEQIDSNGDSRPNVSETVPQEVATPTISLNKQEQKIKIEEEKEGALFHAHDEIEMKIQTQKDESRAHKSFAKTLDMIFDELNGTESNNSTEDRVNLEKKEEIKDLF